MQYSQNIVSSKFSSKSIYHNGGLSVRLNPEIETCHFTLVAHTSSCKTFQNCSTISGMFYNNCNVLQ